ncbi:hypothetical protein J7643_17300 [bacterium]|nr:hypothetical protein [bacterium]
MPLDLDISQLRLLSEAYLATLPPVEEDALEVMPPILQRLFDQAQDQIGNNAYRLDLGAEDAGILRDALHSQLEFAADEGDIFALGELPGIIAQLERVAST